MIGEVPSSKARSTQHGELLSKPVLILSRKDSRPLCFVQGKGFDLALAEGPSEVSSRFGLLSIRERMHALGGSFDIVSAPGQGTRSLQELPLSPADD